MARKNVTFFQTLSKFSDVSVVSKEKGLSYIHIYTWMNYLGNVEIGRSKKGKKRKFDRIYWFGREYKQKKLFYQIKEVFKDEKIFIFIFMCVRNWKIK